MIVLNDCRDHYSLSSNSSVEPNGEQGSSLRGYSKIVSIYKETLKFLVTHSILKNFSQTRLKSLKFPLRFPLEFGQNNETLKYSR